MTKPTQKPNLDLRATRVIEEIVKMLNSEDATNPNSPQAEYVRGGLWGAKWMLSALLGRDAKDDSLHAVRKRLGVRIPTIVGLAPDGNRYGFDSDAG